MKKWPIAIQVYSVRDEATKDFEGTMRSLKEMGYDGVELAGLYGMESAVACKKVLDQVGLELVSAHVPFDALENDAALDDYAATGIKYVAIPWMPAPKDEEELKACIARIRNAGERCKARGMQLLYHNHDFEFEKINDKYILDTYYEEIPADLLQTELDTCWVNVGGEEPAAYVRKYTGRAPVVHLKDFFMSGKLPSHLYALIGLDEEEKEEEESTFEFRPFGSGMQDMKAILDASVDAGASWVVVEQDEPSMDLSRMECIAKARENLASVGW